MDHSVHDHQFNSQVCSNRAYCYSGDICTDCLRVFCGCFSAAFELNWAALGMTITNDFRERTLLYGAVNTIGSLAAVAGYAGIAILPLHMFLPAAVVLYVFSAPNLCQYLAVRRRVLLCCLSIVAHLILCHMRGQRLYSAAEAVSSTHRPRRRTQIWQRRTERPEPALAAHPV